jgi:tRNA(adenine34) deaminase
MIMQVDIDQTRLEKLMRGTLELAWSSFSKGNSPFGCILTDTSGKVLVRSENTTNTDSNPIAHAEINAALQLAKKLGSRKFKDVVLICTVQSCPMCFSALYRSGVRYFIYGCAEDETLVPKIDVHTLNKYCEPPAKIITGVLEADCIKMLKMSRSQK